MVFKYHGVAPVLARWSDDVPDGKLTSPRTTCEHRDSGARLRFPTKRSAREVRPVAPLLDNGKEMDFSGFAFLNGVELPDKTAYFTTLLPGHGPDTEDHTAFLYRREGEAVAPGTVIKRTTMDVTASPDGARICSVDETGVFFDYLHDDGRKSYVRNVDDHRGLSLLFLENLHGRLICGGADFHTYEMQPDGSWLDLSKDEMREAGGLLGFTDAASLSADELYFVGWRGALWSLIAGKWRRTESATQTTLHTATTVSGRCLAAGKLGVILEGRGMDWRAIEHDLTQDDIRSSATVGDVAYFGTEDAILKWEQGELEVFAVAGADLRTTRRIFAGPSGLWAVGTHDISLFDGSSWTTVAQAS